MRNNKINCQHRDFSSDVKVAVLEDSGRYIAEIRITCTGCGTPMQFMGLEPGLNLDGATCSLDGLEANIGIHPQGQRPNPMQKLMGYKIKNHN